MHLHNVGFAAIWIISIFISQCLEVGQLQALTAGPEYGWLEPCCTA